MFTKEQVIGLNVETFVLVAVWENPFVFQGCFKITELHKENTVFFFFRCESSHLKQTDIHDDFSPDEYQFTHLYNGSGLIQLNILNQAQEDALYLLKYALHITLREMLSSRKVHFTSIDDVAMNAFINQVKPILNTELTLPEEEHLGFAVAMDFCPKEEVALMAAVALLEQFKNKDVLN